MNCELDHFLSSFSKFCNWISNNDWSLVYSYHLHMSTEGKVSIFRLPNPTLHLPSPHTEQWQFRTMCSVCTTSTPKPHIWQCLLLLPPYFLPISSGMKSEPSYHEIADFPLTTQTWHGDCHELLPCHTKWGTGRAGHSNNLRKPYTGCCICALPGLASPRLTKVLEQSLPSSSMSKFQGLGSVARDLFLQCPSTK